MFGMLSVVFLTASGGLLLSAVAGAAADRRAVRDGLRTVVASGAAPGRDHLARPATDRLLVPVLRRLGGVARRLTPLSAVARLRRDLVRAGDPSAWDAERVLAMKLVGSGAMTLLAFSVTGAVGLPVPKRIAATFLAWAIAYWTPDLLVRSRAQARQEVLRRALPDALDLLGICVEAGLGFDAALERTVRETEGPLTAELNRTLREMRLGSSRADALRALAGRSSVPELRSFVQAMVQADAFGVSIARVLHVQSKEMRVKRRQRAEEQAQKVPVKIVFPLVLCIFPALFVVLLGPSAISIWRALGGS